MNFKDLKIFKLLYEKRKIVDVSKTLYLSQPTITYRLKKIQDELDVELFYYNKGYIFTEKGKYFYDFCVKILNEFDILKDKVHERKSIRIDLCNTAKYLYLNKLYNAFQKIDIYPIIKFTNSEDALLDLLNGSVLFSIVGGIKDKIMKDFVVKKLLDEKIVLVHNKKCDKKIENIQLVIDEKKSGLYEPVKNYLNSFQDVKISGEIGISIHTLSLIDNNKLGVFLPEKYILEEKEKYNNIIISSKYSFMRNVSFIYKISEKNNIIIDKIIEFLNNCP